MKKSLFFAIALLTVGALHTAAYAGNLDTLKVDGIWYILDKADMTATVTYGPAEGEEGMWGGIGKDTYSGHLIIPATIWVYPEDGSPAVEYAVTAIGDNAFSWCTYLTAITIPASVKTLGVNLLQRSEGVDILKIEDGKEPIAFTHVEEYGSNVISFEELSGSCRTLYLGRNVVVNTTAENPMDPFHMWNMVEHVTFGANVTEIPAAFCPYARNIMDIQVNSTTPLQAGERMFAFLLEEESANPKAVTLYVPEGLKKTYETMDFWKELTIEEMDEERQYGIKWVASSFDFHVGNLFYRKAVSQYGMVGVEVAMPQVWYLNPDGSYVSQWSSEFPYKQSKIVIPEEITVYDESQGGTVTYPVVGIGDYSFRGASNLEELIIPTSVTYVGYEIVEYTDKLRHLDIPESITKVGWLAFARAGFEEIVIPASSSKWTDDNAAFQDCPNLQKATFAKGTTAIQDRIFFGCTALRVIDIPDEVRSIGAGAFAGCEALTELRLPASLEIITNRMFRGCPIRKLEVPAGVTEIEPSAFLGTFITQLTVNPDNAVFDSRENCNAVIRKADNVLVAAAGGAFIPEGVEGVALEAFNELYAIRSVTLPKSMKKIETEAFLNCDNLAIITSNIENPAGVLEAEGFNSWSEADAPQVKATLYVPAGTREKYLADAEWSKFQHIVEMKGENMPADVAELKPVEESGQATFAGLTGVDVTNAIVDNIYVTGDPGNGDRYDDVNNAFFFESVVDELMLENVLANVGNMDIIRNNFSGLIIEIPAGEGTIKITAGIYGNRMLAIQVEGLEPEFFEKAASGEIEFDYNVLKDALVFIYPVTADDKPLAAPTKLQARRGVLTSSDIDAVMIYGAGWEVKKTITGNEEIVNHKSSNRKLIIDGQLFIIRDGKTYNATGAEVR